ncbi:MAG: hypothetical protein U1F98_04450 [Verrucomicrobiota bacterium]
MNPQNRLEAHLRGLQPRRPSRRLERRLFGHVRPRRDAAAVFQWLAPAAACLMLAFTVLRQDDGWRAAGTAGETALVASNQSHQAVLGTRSSQVEYNTPSIFESTNRAGYTSSIGSFLNHKTN